MVPSKPGRRGKLPHLCDTESPLPYCHSLFPSFETSSYRCRARDNSIMAQSYRTQQVCQASPSIPPVCWSLFFLPCLGQWVFRDCWAESPSHPLCFGLFPFAGNLGRQQATYKCLSLWLLKQGFQYCVNHTTSIQVILSCSFFPTEKHIYKNNKKNMSFLVNKILPLKSYSTLGKLLTYLSFSFPTC